MKCAAIFLFTGLALAACRSAPPSEPALEPQAEPVCAPLRAWSDADLKALGDALAPLPDNSIIIRMALDWRRYYGDAKICARRSG